MNNTDTIYGRFYSCVKEHGTLHALTDGENTLTFSELDALVGNYACALSDMYGVRRGTRVGIVMAHGFDMIAAMLAVLRLGGCYVPCELSFPEERIRFMMAGRLAPYMMPEYYVAMRALPMTSNGKVNADALPVILKEGRLVS